MRALHAGHGRPTWVTVLAAYFDDSRGEGLHAIAGYLGVLDVWGGPFATAWQAMLDGAPHKEHVKPDRPFEFKASDCRQGFGNFLKVEKGGWWTAAERDAIYRQAAGIIAEVAFPTMYGVGAVMRIPKQASNEAEERFQRFALVQCLADVVATVLMLAAHHHGSPGGSVLFVADKQKGLQQRFSDAFDSVCDVWRGTYPGEISGLHFEDSHKLAGLQAADLIAYETRKDFKNRLQGRKESGALTYLKESKFHIAYYVDPIHLQGIQRAHRAGEIAPKELLMPILYASPNVVEVMPWEPFPRPIRLRWPYEYTPDDQAK